MPERPPAELASAAYTSTRHGSKTSGESDGSAGAAGVWKRTAVAERVAKGSGEVRLTEPEETCGETRGVVADPE